MAGRVSRDPSRDVIRAAGGVLWRSVERAEDDESAIEIALIHRPRYGDWSVPKGKLAPGESEIQGAVREVFEETGYRVHLGRPLGEVRYMKSSGGVARPKVVRYWAMQADAGCFAPSREVDELRWVPLKEAGDLVTHDHDRELIDRFIRGPALTGCVLIVRHASAGDRSKWSGEDRERPLDEVGWAQAEELVRTLSRFEVDAIVSADYARCVQTVEPLSEALGVPIEIESLFAEDGFPGREEKAADLIRSYGTSGTTTVVCTQGDVIPELVTTLADRDQVDVPDPLPSRKASIWALNFDGPNVFSAEYFAPPRIER